MSHDRVGLLGAGAMGAPIAQRFLEKLGQVAVFDPRLEATEGLRAQGAIVCASPAEVTRHADVVCASLPSPAAALEVVTAADGLLAGDKFGVFVDFSTTGPETAKLIAGPLAAGGVGYVDCPVTGGTPSARAGTLTLLISGEPGAIDRAMPVLETVGTKMVVMGREPGQAQTAKIINNFLSATAIAATAEALTLGARSGLDPVALLEVLNAGSGRNTATSDKFPKYVLPRSFDFGFRLELMIKDVDLCLAQARAVGLPMLLGSTVQQLWRLGGTTLGPTADSTSLAMMFESWAGVELADQGEG